MHPGKCRNEKKGDLESARKLCEKLFSLQGDDVAVQKKLDAADNAEIDALMGLVEELAEFLRTTRQFGDAVWVRTENSPVYSQEHIGEMRQFTSVLTLTYRAMK